jgi:diguanylate cyclase (GGDEF)-like protein/PAS domain S-box-containing protein
VADDSESVRRRLERERRARQQAEAIAEDALRQLYESVRELQRSKAVLDETTDFVLIAELDGRIRYMNRALTELLDLDEQLIAGTAVTDLLTPTSRERFLSEALPVVQEKGVWRGELVMVRPRSGSEVPVSQVLIGHRGPTGVVDSISSISRDITERLAMEEQLTHLALHDPLTGLSNRRLFYERLDVAVARAARSETALGVFFVDIDAFKAINDELGHDAGATVLTTVAQRLLSCVRPADTVCRLGGDEFVVLCEQVADEDEALALAERLGTSIAEPMDVAETERRVTASVGVVLTTAATAPDRLLQDADTAMYEAKRRGKARAYLFNAGEQGR